MKTGRLAGVIAVALGVVAVSLPTSRAAGTETYIYDVHHHRVGGISVREHCCPWRFNVFCGDGGPGYVLSNARGTYANAHGGTDEVLGYALRRRSGTWQIYSQTREHAYAGYAHRRSASRWDVYWRRPGVTPFRPLGYVIGPNGPEAALAAAIFCG